ncbi:hypothetical protein FRC08_008286 [Ceratobasidium sp. 394]|nr:hypothetical protein FRC08_008286 [Ceratobasidium sp. 394]
MGLDVPTFNYLLDAGFRTGWYGRTIPRSDVNPRGHSRPGRRSLDAEGALGVTLYFLGSIAGEAAIEQIFALVPSTLSRYLEFTIPLLLGVLENNVPEALCVWPNHEEMQESSEIINGRHPMIDGAFGFMDGLNLPCQMSGDPVEQSAMYNGWCQAHVVSNFIVFDPKGMIIRATTNAPGSWHDAKVAAVDIYNMLLDETPENFFIIADSAFMSNDEDLAKKIHTPLKQNTIFPGLTDEEVEMEWEYSHAIVTARQAVEWGMRAIQGSFARLRVLLDANDKAGR